MPSARPSVSVEQKTDVDDEFPRLVWRSVGTDGNAVESSGGPAFASEAGLQLMVEKFSELDWEAPPSAPSFTVELSDDTRLSVALSSNDSVQIIATATRPGPLLGKTTTAIVRRSAPLKGTSHALSLLEDFMKSNGEDFESGADWQTGPENAQSNAQSN